MKIPQSVKKNLWNIKHIAGITHDVICFIICFCLMFSAIGGIYFYIDKIIKSGGTVSIPGDLFMTIIFIAALPFMLSGFWLGRATKDVTIYDALRRLEDVVDLAEAHTAIIKKAKDLGQLDYLIKTESLKNIEKNG